MVVAAAVLLLVLEHDVEGGAVVVGGEDLALVADQERAAAWELAAHLDDFLGEVGAGTKRRELLVIRVAVVPPELQGGQTLALGELKTNARALREGLLIDARGDLVL